MRLTALTITPATGSRYAAGAWISDDLDAVTGWAGRLLPEPVGSAYLNGHAWNATVQAHAVLSSRRLRSPELGPTS